MGAMLVPAMIGAGVGAAGGAISGRNPFKSALLGGALGAGGAGLMGGAGGATGGITGLSSSIPSVGIPTSALQSGIGMAGLPTSAMAAPGLGVSLATNPMTNPLNYSLGASNLLAGGNAIYEAPSLLGNISNPFTNMSTIDKINLGARGLDILNQPQQPMQPAPVMPITRGNPEMVSSPLMNVAPNVGMQQGNDVGIPNLMTRMPLSDEEKMRLQQLAQGYRG